MSSGARERLALVIWRKKESNGDLYMKQALCAAEQVQLMKLYETVFDLFGERIAQILVNRDDFGDRKRFSQSQKYIL